jgi:CubicO group peptidase (beta-lactamase class C family)
VVLQTPIWAPASALASSASDMAVFAAAALGHTQVGSLTVPPAITQAFSMAEAAYACQGVNPSVTGCGGYFSGLGWRIQANAPATIAKDGAVSGYSSYVVLMPNSDTAVVVLSNSYNGSAEATTIGNGIIYGLYFAGLLPTR